MDFTLIGPDKLKVDLTANDLAGLALEYKDLDHKDERTRQVLIDLIARGREAAGFSPRSAKLYIEIYPREEGGCVIYYTKLTTGQLDSGGSFLPGPTPVVFAFEDIETLLAAGRRAYALFRHRILKSCLYTRGRSYRLIIYPLDFGEGPSVSFLREYARLVGEGSVLTAHIEEHWQLLTADNALETLANIEGAK
ncbi:MAG: adaptor protein MecA [Oscillospiraceae bacterium]|nr:adaptor protein MecA [Oscillospiraceae bacterium]